MENKVKFTARLPLTISKRGKWFIASCPILDVHSQGETEEQAKKNLGNALSLFFISCYERGTLDAALKECGFQLDTTEEEIVEQDENFIDVPLKLRANKTQFECHA